MTDKGCFCCLYKWWGKRLIPMCRHPDHHLPLKKDGYCKDFVEQNKKTMPGHVRGHPEPVR